MSGVKGAETAVLTIPLAIEKVLYRLALLDQGIVPIARAFVELPISVEEVEEYADRIADGTAVLKNEWGEYLVYEFPELQRQMPAPPEDCPTCGGEQPTQVTEAGEVVRRPLLCDTCYEKLKKLHRVEPEDGMLEKFKGWFVGEQEENFVQIARVEHEIFFLGVRSGVEQLTHTTLAAQSRLPSSQIKERLDRMAARRYIQVGLLPSGDAVAYSFPTGLTYPQTHYRRLDRDPAKSTQKMMKVDVAEQETIALGGAIPRPTVKPVIKPKKRFDIKIKGRRTRGE